MTLSQRVVAALLLATMGAAFVFVTSVSLGFPRVWPGVAYFFVSNSISTFLILTWAKR